MLTEQDIAIQLKRPMASPLRVGHIAELGLHPTGLIDELAPHFANLSDDPYLGRAKQLAFLRDALPAAETELDFIAPSFHAGRADLLRVARILAQLSPAQREIYSGLARVTRQRSIARFVLQRAEGQGGAQVAVGLSPKLPVPKTWLIDRQRGPGSFAQAVDDFRVQTREFEPASEESVAGPHFRQALRAFADVVATIHPDIEQLGFTVHLMRSLALSDVPAENSPEGIHEDGAAYTVSALVIGRDNVHGAENQVFEQFAEGKRELLFQQELAPGEFIFQADTGEENTFGNDLWHYLTPAFRADSAAVRTRDILGLDIELLG